MSSYLTVDKIKNPVNIHVMNKYQELLLKLINSTDINSMSLRRIAGLLGLDHPQKVKHHLLQLEKNGYIVIDNKLIRKTDRFFSVNNSELISIPVLGKANCGEALQTAVASMEGFLKVSPEILSINTNRYKNTENLFALKAVGKSMDQADINGKSIDDGDYVIIEKTDVINNGDYVLSVIDGSANIKKLKLDRENKQIILISESKQDYPPIVIHSNNNHYINGKVVQVIKI